MFLLFITYVIPYCCFVFSDLLAIMATSSEHNTCHIQANNHDVKKLILQTNTFGDSDNGFVLVFNRNNNSDKLSIQCTTESPSTFTLVNGSFTIAPMELSKTKQPKDSKNVIQPEQMTTICSPNCLLIHEQIVDIFHHLYHKPENLMSLFNDLKQLLTLNKTQMNPYCYTEFSKHVDFTLECFSKYSTPVFIPGLGKILRPYLHLSKDSPETYV